MELKEILVLMVVIVSIIAISIGWFKLMDKIWNIREQIISAEAPVVREQGISYCSVCQRYFCNKCGNSIEREENGNK